MTVGTVGTVNLTWAGAPTPLETRVTRADAVLDRLLSGTPIGRIAGGEAMKFGGWQRLNAEYARQFGIETPNWPPQAAQKP